MLIIKKTSVPVPVILYKASSQFMEGGISEIWSKMFVDAKDISIFVKRINNETDDKTYGQTRNNTEGNGLGTESGLSYTCKGLNGVGIENRGSVSGNLGRNPGES